MQSKENKENYSPFGFAPNKSAITLIDRICNPESNWLNSWLISAWVPRSLGSKYLVSPIGSESAADSPDKKTSVSDTLLTLAQKLCRSKSPILACTYTQILSSFHFLRIRKGPSSFTPGELMFFDLTEMLGIKGSIYLAAKLHWKFQRPLMELLEGLQSTGNSVGESMKCRT